MNQRAVPAVFRRYEPPKTEVIPFRTARTEKAHGSAALRRIEREQAWVSWASTRVRQANSDSDVKHIVQDIAHRATTHQAANSRAEAMHALRAIRRDYGREVSLLRASSVGAGITDGDPEVRAAAAKALGTVGVAGVAFASPLCGLVRDDASDAVRVAAVRSTAAMYCQLALPATVSSEQRTTAMAELVNTCASACDDPIWSIREAAITGLARCVGEADLACATAARLVSDDNEWVRQAAVCTLVTCLTTAGAQTVKGCLKPILLHCSPDVEPCSVIRHRHIECLEALETRRHFSSVDASLCTACASDALPVMLSAVLQDVDWRVRSAAARVVICIAGSWIVKDGWSIVACVVAEQFARISMPEARRQVLDEFVTEPNAGQFMLLAEWPLAGGV